jgi:hypothetical protein
MSPPIRIVEQLIESNGSAEEILSQNLAGWLVKRCLENFNRQNRSDWIAKLHLGNSPRANGNDSVVAEKETRHL